MQWLDDMHIKRLANYTSYRTNSQLFIDLPHCDIDVNNAMGDIAQAAQNVHLILFVVFYSKSNIHSCFSFCIGWHALVQCSTTRATLIGQSKRKKKKKKNNARTSWNLLHTLEKGYSFPFVLAEEEKRKNIRGSIQHILPSNIGWIKLIVLCQSSLSYK